MESVIAVGYNRFIYPSCAQYCSSPTAVPTRTHCCRARPSASVCVRSGVVLALIGVPLVLVPLVVGLVEPLLGHGRGHGHGHERGHEHGCDLSHGLIRVLSPAPALLLPQSLIVLVAVLPMAVLPTEQPPNPTEQPQLEQSPLCRRLAPLPARGCAALQHPTPSCLP